MSDLELSIGDRRVEPSDDWTFAWLDADHGIAQLSRGDEQAIVLVEGAGSHWVVTVRGRRLMVTARTWRERTLADAEVATRSQAGPLEIKATLPGLIVAIGVEEGSEVTAGEPMLTIEAMKMQNEVRAPRSGRVTTIAVQAGQTVATGALLLRLG